MNSDTIVVEVVENNFYGCAFISGQHHFHSMIEFLPESKTLTFVRELTEEDEKKLLKKTTKERIEYEEYEKRKKENEKQ